MQPATPEEMFELVHGRRTNDPSWFEFNDRVLSPGDVVTILAPAISERRKHTIERVLTARTDDVTVVVEGMVDLGNVSAVMRSAEGFGVHAFHTIDTANAYKRSRRTTRGTDKWLDRYRWEDVESCYAHLRATGYRIVAATTGDDAIPIEETDLSERVALVFGNELEGISRRARELADVHMTIPMFGFAESFNVSVAASVALYEARRMRRIRHGSDGGMGDAERATIRAVWYLKSVRESRLVVERTLRDGYEPAGTT
jgi:tRNA (guanosine-2'-O-)-methyltransferase